MSKKNSVRPAESFREALPKIEKDDKGANVLMCPFCVPSHPILPFVPGPCGTAIEIKAIQKIYHAKYNKNMICARCHEGGGKMVLINNVFFHAHNCAPGVLTLTQEPKYSAVAKIVYNMKDGRLKKFIQDRMGKAASVDEVTPEGNKTGKVLGYFFHRSKNDNTPGISNRGTG